MFLFNRPPPPWTPQERIALVKRLAEAQNNRCAYCHFPMALPEKAETVRGSNLMTIDHVIPRAKGGNDEEDNLVAACKKCNSTRGRHNANVFADIIEFGLRDSNGKRCSFEDWHQVSYHEPREQRQRREELTQRIYNAIHRYKNL